MDPAAKLETVAMAVDADRAALQFFDLDEAEVQLLAGLEVAIGTRAQPGSTTPDFQAYLESNGWPAEDVRHFVTGLQDGSFSWMQVIGGRATSVKPHRRDVLALAAATTSPWIEAMDDSADFTFVLRRLDACLEALDSSMNRDAALGQWAETAADIQEQSADDLTKVLRSPWAAGGAAFALGFVGIPAGGAVVWAQDRLLQQDPSETAWLLAVPLVASTWAIEHGDLGPARRLGQWLLRQLQEAGSAASGGRSDKTRAALLRILTLALERVNQHLGEDEQLLPELAPNFLYVRLSEVQAMAQVQAIALEVLDVGGQPGKQRTVWQSTNWSVVQQSPRPGEPLGKRRNVKVAVIKPGEMEQQHKAFAVLPQGDDPL